ncbi:MAG: hypothetical protein GQ578_06175 [Desulfuromonadaceae bacterium]|nr:hypothetical protein [Desulfuromonadaceae bacterium]
MTFDLSQPPPSRQELAREKARLLLLKKQQIKWSVMSDASHGLILLGIYYFDLLSGYGLLLAVGLATATAILLASGLKKRLQTADIISVAGISLVAMLAVAGILYGWKAETLTGSLLTGLVAGSIVCVGALLGGKVLQVFQGLENLKSLAENDQAVQEMLSLCRQQPALEAYRQRALEILRPNLTFGELQAMRDWVASHST